MTFSAGALDDDLKRNLWCVLGLPFDSTDLARAEAVLQAAVREQRQIVLSTPNVNWVVTARHDGNFRRAALDSEFSTADGMPIVWAAKLLQLPFAERVGGSNLIDNLLSRKLDKPLSIFLFGGEEGVAKRACEHVNAYGGGLTAVGYIDPGHGSVESMSRQDLIATINTSAPDILLVSLGARKGQSWIEHNRHRLNATVISHLGATINFLAGTLRRAPAWMQRSGLEWAWRIFEEPKLFTRYTRDGAVLAWLFLTRLLPYWMHLRFGETTAGDTTILSTELQQTTAYVQVALQGAATHHTLEPAKTGLRQAVLSERDIVVDLTAVQYVDSAFIALLMTVRKHLSRNERRLTIKGASSRLQRLFRYNCAEFLLDEDQKSLHIRPG